MGELGPSIRLELGTVSLSRTLRLVVDPQVRLESLPLGPQEYFVLSRIEGRPSVSEVIGASGLGAAQTEQILEALLKMGAIKGEQDTAPTRPVKARPRKSTVELRAQAADRRKRMLAQQLGQGRSNSPTASTPRAPAPTPTPVPTPAPVPELQADQGPVVEPAPSDDPRLDDALGLTADQQRHLLALEDRLDELTPFELLGLRPTDDVKVIRTAFREASRSLHPDAYHGRELGRYRELLSTLFVRAKQALESLQDPEVRAPFLAAVEAEAQERRRRQEQREAARKAAEELRRRREVEEANKRRVARTAQRAERERERLADAVHAKVAAYLQAAADAEGLENFASAANNYRLALQLDPNDATIRARWDEARGIARRKRAKDAFSQACTYVEVGHANEGVPLFLEAADADPTLEHVAHAADAVRMHDAGRARDLALHALRLLTEREQGGPPLRPGAVADLRLMIGRAFLAAGQAQSAREQARLVQKLRPGDPGARALLNSVKVT